MPTVPVPRAKMDNILKRIKRCIIQGQVRFTFKAELEMLADELSRVDVLEAILSAPGISKVLKSPRKSVSGAGERLYVILGSRMTASSCIRKANSNENPAERFSTSLSPRREPWRDNR